MNKELTLSLIHIFVGAAVLVGLILIQKKKKAGLKSAA